jgi:hypothetical protein
MPKEKEDLSSKLKGLIEELEKITPPTGGPAIDVQDIYLPLNHLFSQATKRAFRNQVKTLKSYRKLANPVTLNQVIQDEVRYFGATALSERKIFDAAKAVVDYVNQLSSQGYVTGYLTKLSIIRLASEPHELEKYMVFCFPCLTPDGIKSVDINDHLLSIKEGEIPRYLVKEL